MKYLLLIYDTEKNMKTATVGDRRVMTDAYTKFTDEIRKSGHMLAGDALQPTGTATTVRVRDGKKLHTDGPFAETKEQLGGYYLIEAADLDDALAVAARIPSAASGCVEVRPVVVFG